MERSVRRLLIEAAVVGFVFVAIFAVRFFLPVDAVNDVTGHPIGRDFLNVWGAPRVAAEHGAAALSDIARYPELLSEVFGHPLNRFFNWAYPPHALLLLAPFSQPPYPIALALWTLIGLGGFGASVAAGLPREARVFGAAMALLAPVTFVTVLTGQNGLVLGALMLFTIRCIGTRPLLAGVLFGLLTIKPQLGLLVPVALVAIGAWRTIAAAAATALALGLMSVAAFGLEPWRLWLTTSADYSFALILDIAGFHRFFMVSISAAASLLDLPAVARWTLQGLGVAFAAFAVWTAFRRTEDRTTRALVLTLAAMLATPYGFSYDLGPLTGAVIWTLAERSSLSNVERRVFGLLYLLPIAIVPLHLALLPISPLIFAGGLALALRPLLRPENARPIRMDAGFAVPLKEF